MEAQKIMEQLLSLPPEAQKEAADFIAFLQSRYGRKLKRSTKKKIPLENDPFVGMWKDRKEMEDSVEWVRALRRSQWSRKKNDDSDVR